MSGIHRTYSIPGSTKQNYPHWTSDGSSGLLRVPLSWAEGEFVSTGPTASLDPSLLPSSPASIFTRLLRDAFTCCAFSTWLRPSLPSPPPPEWWPATTTTATTTTATSTTGTTWHTPYRLSQFPAPCSRQICAWWQVAFSGRWTKPDITLFII